MGKVPIYVINLNRSAERMAFIAARLQGLSLDYTRIAAVDGAGLSQAERDAFVAARPRDGRRGWRPGQIGCLMSHQDAWRRIAAGPAAWGLVLEDDLHISDSLPAVIAQVERLPADADVVRLESTGQWLKLAPEAATVDRRAVRRVRSAAWGAGAYLLSSATAARLVATPPVQQSPADDFLFNPPSSAVARRLVTYQIVPALASQDKFAEDRRSMKGFGSDIETDRVNGRLSALSAWRRRITSFLRGKSEVGVR